MSCMISSAIKISSIFRIEKFNKDARSVSVFPKLDLLGVNKHGVISVVELAIVYWYHSSSSTG